MSRLIILGSGTPVPTPERWGAGYLLEIGGEWLMVDCGPASTYKMHLSGVPCTKINNLFFTHLHSDHMSDYPCFLMTRFDLSTGVEPDLNVYGPPPIKDITERLWTKEHGVLWYDVIARTNHPMSVGAFHHRGGKGPRPEPVVHVHEFSEGKVATGENWECYAREVEHAQPYLGCFGFRFETEEGIVAFSGDTAPAQSVVDLARDADVFVMQAVYRESTIKTHTSRMAQTGTIGAGRMAQEAGAKRLVITHQSHTLSRPDLISEAIHDIKSVYDGSVFWGRDRMEIDW